MDPKVWTKDFGVYFMRNRHDYSKYILKAFILNHCLYICIVMLQVGTVGCGHSRLGKR